MLSSQGTSLLHKLGRKLAYEMSEVELETLVAANQRHRTIARAMGRAAKFLTQKSPSSKSAKPRSKRALVLDSYVAPAIATALRKKWPGKTDPELISMLQGKGLL